MSIDQNQVARPILTLDSFKKKAESNPASIEHKLTDKILETTKVLSPEVLTNSDLQANTPTINLSNGTVNNTKSTEFRKKSISSKDYYPMLKYFQEHYPKCFPLELPTPLAIGIHSQLFVIEDLPFFRMKIRAILGRYTSIKNYQKNLIIDTDRVNLSDEIATKVLETELQYLKSKNSKKLKTAQERDDINQSLNIENN